MNKNYNCSKTLLLSKNNMQHQVYFKPDNTDWIVFSIHEVVTGSEISFGMQQQNDPCHHTLPLHNIHLQVSSTNL